MKNSREIINKRAHSGTHTTVTCGTSSAPFLARVSMKKLQMTTRNYILGLPKYFTLTSMLISWVGLQH